MSGIISEQSLLSIGAPPVMPMSGVRFDNTSVSTGLTVASQTATNSPLVTVSMFVRSISFTGSSILMLSKNVNDAMYLIPGYNFSDDIYFNYFDTSNSAQLDSVAGAYPVDTWSHIFMSADMNHAAGAKICNMLVNGVAVGVNSSSFSSSAFSFQLSAHLFGLPIDLPNLGPGGIGTVTDYQSVWVGFGQYVDPAGVGLFRDAATHLPKDLGSDGSGPTGIAPTYYFRGNAASFVANHGSGSAVTVTGTPTDISP